MEFAELVEGVQRVQLNAQFAANTPGAIMAMNSPGTERTVYARFGHPHTQPLRGRRVSRTGLYLDRALSRHRDYRDSGRAVAASFGQGQDQSPGDHVLA